MSNRAAILPRNSVPKIRPIHRNAAGLHHARQRIDHPLNEGWGTVHGRGRSSWDADSTGISSARTALATTWTTCSEPLTALRPAESAELAQSPKAALGAPGRPHTSWPNSIPARAVISDQEYCEPRGRPKSEHHTSYDAVPNREILRRRKRPSTEFPMIAPHRRICSEIALFSFA